MGSLGSDTKGIPTFQIPDYQTIVRESGRLTGAWIALYTLLIPQEQPYAVTPIIRRSRMQDKAENSRAETNLVSARNQVCWPATLRSLPSGDREAQHHAEMRTGRVGAAKLVEPRGGCRLVQPTLVDHALQCVFETQNLVARCVGQEEESLGG